MPRTQPDVAHPSGRPVALELAGAGGVFSSGVFVLEDLPAASREFGAELYPVSLSEAAIDREGQPSEHRHQNTFCPSLRP